jgi:hypothetical protein
MKTCSAFLLVALVVVVASGQIRAESTAMIQAKLYANPDIWRLSRMTSMECYDEEILRYPVKGCISYVPNSETETQCVVTFIVDHTFDGILYRDEWDAIFRSYGHHGYGNGPEFFSPTSIDVYTDQHLFGSWSYFWVFVADWWNDRIKRLKYNWDTKLWTDMGPITGNGLYRPIDLDYHNGGDFEEETDDHVWVLNSNCLVKLFTPGGDYVMTYGSQGSGVGEFQSPTALVCGRASSSPDPGFQPYANTNYLYVADAGNDRIVQLKIVGTNLEWYRESSNPLFSEAVDLETDNFGNLWVVLSTGGVLKYTKDLDYLAAFGSEGFGPNQFYEPYCISNIGGRLCVGELLVTESWEDSSGIQRYIPGASIEDLWVTTFVVADVCWCAISFRLAEYSRVALAIYNEDNELQCSWAPGSVMSSGTQTVYWGTDVKSGKEPPEMYHALVTATNVYEWGTSGDPVNSDSQYTDWFDLCEGDDFCESGDGATHPPGDCSQSGGYDIDDIVCLINHVFEGADVWCTPYGSDADSSGNTDIDDIVFLINHVFGGGPPPISCEEWVDAHGEPNCGY